jgi:uncharacterized membrane protein
MWSPAESFPPPLSACLPHEIMKKYFLTGLAIILPFVVTVALIQAIVNLLTAPFLGIVEHLFPSTSLNPYLLTLFSKFLILLFLFFATAAVGYSAEYLLVHTLIGWGNRVIRKIPLIGNVYQMIQDIIQTFYGKEDQFSKVGKIPFPSRESTTLGFVTNENMKIQGKEELGAFASVYVPGNPNPMMGFWLLVPQDQVAALDLSAREASRFIFSCGVLKARDLGQG